MIRVALLGGSFNPIHNAHTALAKYVIDQDFADEVWFVVSPHNPLKDKSELAPWEDRLEMVRLAIEEESNFKICTIEQKLPKPSYTYRTLAYLRQEYTKQGYKFLLMIGSDNWNKFEQWRYAEEIITHHDILIYPRPGSPVNQDTLRTNTFLLDSPLLAVSSTEIRQSLCTAATKPAELNLSVWEYIRRHKLYAQ